MQLTFEIVQTCVSIQNTNDHEVLNDSHKYFTFVSCTCSFSSMYILNIPHLAVIFVYNAMTFLLQFIHRFIN